MVTENTSLGASRNNIILGSGLSGMIAAYINARALEDDAAHNANWHAQQAFRSKGKRWGIKWFASRRGGTAVVS